MTTEKVTVSLDNVAAALARASATREGLTLSAWLSLAARREAVRAGAGPVGAGERDALLDEHERVVAEQWPLQS